MKIQALAFVMCVAHVHGASTSLKAKLSNKLQRARAKNLRGLLSKEMTTDWPDFDGPAPCRADEGCTCTSDHVYAATETCVRTTVERLMNKKECNAKIEVASVDCQVCNEDDWEGDTTTIKTRCTSVEKYPTKNYVDLVDTWTIKGKECSHNFKRESCTGPSPPPIDRYLGFWRSAGSQSTVSATQTIEYTSSSTETQEESYKHGWKLEGTVEVSWSAPSATGGLGGKLSVTSGEHKDWESNTAKSITNQVKETHTVTCALTPCENAESTFWEYIVTGSASSDPNYNMHVPYECHFKCMAPGHSHAPLCPPGYCGGPPETCSCCMNVKWIDPASAAENPELVPPVCCTNTGKDPWGSDWTTAHVPCCEGNEEQLQEDGRYLCVWKGSDDCTTAGNDPYATGVLVDCCDGSEKELQDDGAFKCVTYYKIKGFASKFLGGYAE